MARVALTDDNGAFYGAPATWLNNQYARRSAVMNGSRTIVLGDSIDSQNYGWFPYVAVLSGKINVAYNAGIGGNTTDQMLARIQTDVLDRDPDIVILGSNTNDHGAGFPESQSRENIATMVDQIIAAGATPVFRTTAPVDVASGSVPYETVALRRQAVLRHNAWLKTYAEPRGIPVLDVYTAWADPATGGFKSGYAADGIHPTEAAHRAAADHLISVGLPPVFTGGFNLARAVTDDANVLKNGVFIGDGNADGLADNWAFGSGITAKSLIPSADGVGNWQRIETDGVAGGWMNQHVTSTATDTRGNLLYEVGDLLELSGRVRTSGGVPVIIRMSQRDGTPDDGTTPVYQKTTAIEDGIFSGRMTVGSGATRITAETTLGSPGAPTVPGWAEVSEFAIRNLTKLGLA